MDGDYLLVIPALALALVATYDTFMESLWAIR
jgi:hypothetical protein